MPLILCLLIAPCFKDACGCLYKNEPPPAIVEEAPAERGEGERREQQLIMLNNNGLIDNNAEGAEGVRFAAIQRSTTNKAMDNIMLNWRRKFSLKDKNRAESCCVCLEDFKKEDQIIELKCGQGHIFHPQ